MFFISFQIPNSEHKNVQVCQRFFLSATRFSKFRIIRIAKVLKSGNVPTEKRGGDKVSHLSAVKKDNVRRFIKSLRGTESHYGRGKSVRIYLPCDLSISKLHKMYNSKNNEQKVSFSMFQKIFTTEFNIGFRSPASDVCALCTRLDYQIQAENDPEKKENMKSEKRVHTLRAKAFYDLAKESPPSSLSLCFDMEQVQPLPRTPVQDAFYYHQISLYTLCIVGMDSKNPTFYSWSEEQAGRGAVEVASAVISHISNLNLEHFSSLRLFCDGCAGQNKNSHMIHALLFWLQNKSPESINSVTLHFPVRGHSFLPADRVFGRVEKLIRKKPTLDLKEDYYEIYETVGSVKKLGEDWSLHDIKSLEVIYKKLSGISNFKRILLKKKANKTGISVEVVGSDNYKFEELADKKGESLVKRGRSPRHDIAKLKLGHQVKNEKKVTVEKLLKAKFGVDWRKNRQLEFYKNILDQPDTAQNEDTSVEPEPEETCNCCEEDCGLRI